MNMIVKRITIKEEKKEDPKKYLVYFKFDKYPVFVYANFYEDNGEFYIFIRNGEYIASFPMHHVKEIKIEESDGE